MTSTVEQETFCTQCKEGETNFRPLTCALHCHALLLELQDWWLFVLAGIKLLNHIFCTSRRVGELSFQSYLKLCSRLRSQISSSKVRRSSSLITNVKTSILFNIFSTSIAIIALFHSLFQTYFRCFSL